MSLLSKLKLKYQKSPKDRTEVHVVLAFVVVPIIGMSLFGLYVFTVMI